MCQEAAKPDQEKQVRFDQLPPRVRHEFEAMRAKLGSELTIGNYRWVNGGWVANVFTLDGHNGGDYMVLTEPGEQPHG